MELEDVHSELHALRKLYGLLQISKDGLDVSSVNLDEKARLLFKNLLDCATESVFKTHSKIIAAQSGVSNKPYSAHAQPEKPEATPKLQLPASQIIIQNSSKDSNFHTITSLNNKSSPTWPTHQGITLEQSKPSISGTKHETRKKCCRVCGQSSMKQLNSARETKIFNKKTQCQKKDGNDEDQQHTEHISYVPQVNGHVKGLLKNKSIKSLENIEKARQKSSQKFQQHASAVRSLACSSFSTLATAVVKPGCEQKLACEIDKKLEDVDYISKEVAKAIQQIESHLASVQLPTEVVGQLKEKNAAHHGLCMMAKSISIADTVGPIIQTKEEISTRSEPSQAADSVFVGNVLLSQQVNHGVWKVEGSSPANKVLSQSQKPVSMVIDLTSPVVSQREGKLREKNDVLSQLASQKGGKRKGSTTLADNLPSQASKPIAGHELPSQVPGQNVKAIVEKLESLSSLPRSKDPTASQTLNYVHGLRVSPSREEFSKVLPLHTNMSGRISKEIRGPMAQEQTSRKIGTSKPSMLPQSMGSTDFVGPNRRTQAVDPHHKRSQAQTKQLTRIENNLPRQMIVRPTLLDHKSNQITVHPTFYKDQTDDRKRCGVHKSTYDGPRNKFVRPQQLSEETSSISRASSDWSTQPTSTSSGESERPLPHTTASWTVGPKSRRLGPMAGDNSSEENDFSHDREYDYSDVGPPHHVGTTESYRLGPKKKPPKQIGRLRRLKNKLGLIFHHHHHHHHHHHRNHGNDQADVAHTTSLWKYMQKIFHSRNNGEVCSDQAVENLRRSLVSSVPRKNQRGHFQTLVEGLMKHARQSKKSKSSKGGTRRLGNGQHGRNKALKKLHWWEVFQRNRGVKLPNRGRVKLGFMSKKPQLRAAKMS